MTQYASYQNTPKGQLSSHFRRDNQIDTQNGCFVQYLLEDEDVFIADARNQYASKVFASLGVPHAEYYGALYERRAVRFQLIQGDTLSDEFAKRINDGEYRRRVIEDFCEKVAIPFYRKIKHDQVPEVTGMDDYPWVVHTLRQQGAVFQHNDMNATNMFYDEQKREVILIDYEGAGFSYAGRDVISFCIDPQINLSEEEISMILDYMRRVLGDETILAAGIYEGSRKKKVLEHMARRDEAFLKIAQQTYKNSMNLLDLLDKRHNVRNVYAPI